MSFGKMFKEINLINKNAFCPPNVKEKITIIIYIRTYWISDKNKVELTFYIPVSSGNLKISPSLCLECSTQMFLQQLLQVSNLFRLVLIIKVISLTKPNELIRLEYKLMKSIDLDCLDPKIKKNNLLLPLKCQMNTENWPMIQTLNKKILELVIR